MTTLIMICCLIKDPMGFSPEGCHKSETSIVDMAKELKACKELNPETVSVGATIE